jgi:plasmid stability protein
MQYSVRNVPPELDARLRAISAAEGRSLNDVVIELLRAAVGLGPDVPRVRDLSDIAGSWVDDPLIDDALDAQRRVDESLWK